MNKKNKILIAIDGPAASGKGSLAARLAKELRLSFLPTGNIYRALAKKVSELNIPTSELKTIEHIALTLKVDDIFTEGLQTDEVAQVASKISVLPEVRKALLDFQHKFIDESKGAVIEGRDIGTTICPEAKLKIFLTADVEVRAKRRLKDLKDNSTYQQILASLKDRDIRDSSRSSSPLAKAEDAVIIDSTDMSGDDVFIMALSLASKIYKL
jgi:CMP/dCMP kinase